MLSSQPTRERKATERGMCTHPNYQKMNEIAETICTIYIRILDILWSPTETRPSLLNKTFSLAATHSLEDIFSNQRIPFDIKLLSLYSFTGQ